MMVFLNIDHCNLSHVSFCVTAPGGAQYIIQAAATGQIIQASQPTAVTTSAISASAHSNTTEQQVWLSAGAELCVLCCHFRLTFAY